MTVKRFTFMQDTLAKADVFDNNEFVCCTLSVWVEQLVDLLNELNDENQELHIQNDFLKDENRHMRTVINENMQLKKLLRKISNCNGEIWLSNGTIIRLKKIFKGEWIK